MLRFTKRTKTKWDSKFLTGHIIIERVEHGYVAYRTTGDYLETISSYEPTLNYAKRKCKLYDTYINSLIDSHYESWMDYARRNGYVYR